MKNLAGQFKQLYREKKWQEAKEVYITAVKLSVGLSDKEKIELFGNRPYRKKDEKEIEGLFPEWMVREVSEMCIFGKRVTKK